MKGDVKGVECFCYFRGKDGLGTCNTGCQWWPKENEIPVKEFVCPFWIPREDWETPKDIPKGHNGKFCITQKEYEDRYNIKIEVIEA